MKILLTGATGYIGSYLSNYLSEKAPNLEISLLCKTLPEYFDSWKNKFDIIESDVTDLARLRKDLTEEMDCIIHLASFNDVNSSKAPEAALTVNGIGTRNMLEIARSLDCKSFIYFSTLQVYGKELKGDITVESPINCFDDYALTHHMAEEYCKMFSLRYNLNTSVVRPSNVFGCPVDFRINRWTLVPTCFCLSAYKHNNITLNSSGKQKRDFVSLEFVSKGIKRLIMDHQPGFNVYNISSEQLFSIREVADIVCSCSKSVFKKDIDIICKSNYPLRSTNFLVRNNLLDLPRKKNLRSELLVEIEKICGLLVKECDVLEDGPN